MDNFINWICDIRNIAMVTEGLLAVIGGASVIAKAIPGKKDDEVVEGIQKYVLKFANLLNMVALNNKK